MDPITFGITLGAAGAAGGEKLYADDVFSTYLYEGNGSTQTIRNGIGLVDGVNILPGTALGGGYFAGFISQTADGNATHALIVAPAASGYNGKTTLQWKTSQTSTSGTTSEYDGAANTANMADANHPAANYCAGLTIGGYSDWYLPARYELEIAYYNLKPTTTSNNTGFGTNSYAVPQRGSNYTAGNPAQTSVAAFQSGGAEDFIATNHWSSTEGSSTAAWKLVFSTGNQVADGKTSALYVRAFRKIAINDSLLDPYRVTGEGGLVWIKNRENAFQDNALFDTERGAGYVLSSNTTGAQFLSTSRLSALNSNGFTVGGDTATNESGKAIVSWTFRKAPGFFDVVTYTGTGSARTVAHNLGSVPGMIMIKNLDNSGPWWAVYHHSLGNQVLYLNETTAVQPAGAMWDNTTPTSSVFTVGTPSNVNTSGENYVAYLFAHDDQSFGTNGNESIIKCGEWTGNGTVNNATTEQPGPEINLGWEPQFVLIKNASATGDWWIFDTMRGFVVDGNGVQSYLYTNTSAAEGTIGGSFQYLKLTSTGFKITAGTGAYFNESGNKYVYMAIRRPHKPLEAGTDVFAIDTYGGTAPTPPTWNSGFPVDWGWYKYSNQANEWATGTRLLQGKKIVLNTTAAETSDGAHVFDYQNGWLNNTGTLSTLYSWMFRRAPGFFDVVAWIGDSQATGADGKKIQPHGLGVAPELILMKNRTNTWDWWSWHKDLTSSATRQEYAIRLNLSDAEIELHSAGTGPLLPDADNFYLASGTQLNQAGYPYIGYLFATLPGISKVGSYTGTGSDINVDCGFTAGARFVLIKRMDASGDWYVWDTARGIISGNDPYLLINSTAAEVTSTDYIDPLNAGFTVTSSAPAALNDSGGTYIFLAIA